MQFPFNELSDIVKQVFPKAPTDFIENLDDVNSCLNIATEPFETIRISGPQAGGLWIKIERYSVQSWAAGGPQLVVKKIWDGYIPATKGKEPNFDFIETMLNNYKGF